MFRFLLSSLLLCLSLATQGQSCFLRGSIVDSDGSPVDFASVALLSQQGAVLQSSSSSSGGSFLFVAVPPGHYQLLASMVGFAQHRQDVSLRADTVVNVVLRSDAVLHEVVVIAREAKSSVSTSTIGRDAMNHIQPNSLADVMELLPGGSAKDPDMGSANSFALRETGLVGASGSVSHNNNYNISSLGTQVVVDGAPLLTDANLQYSPTASTQSSATVSSAEEQRNNTNRGVDMRTISTDDIESIEVVRGIPSVEYGNLTSGMVNIHKIRKQSPFKLRFKADGYSKLLSLGKGFALDSNNVHVLNVDLGYLNSKVDPTNNLENFKRLTASLRLTSHRPGGLVYEGAVDYSGSFDNSKSDPDLNFGRIDKFESRYNRLALTSNLRLSLCQSALRLSFNSQVAQQFDRLVKQQVVAPQRYGIVPTSSVEGESVAHAVYSEYIADYLCDGKPFSAFVKLKADWLPKSFLSALAQSVKFGADWSLVKNFGRGQVYDLFRPLSVSNWNSRPRNYSDIPALHNLSWFIEDKINFAGLEILGGVRFNALPGLDSRFFLAGKVFADPRINATYSWSLRSASNSFMIGAGFGKTSKMPTLNYLFPDKYYTSFSSLAYYDAQNPRDSSLFVVSTFVQDPTNFNLHPARNVKWEVRIALNLWGNSLDVSYFDEDMTDGFRYRNVVGRYSYTKYDVSYMSPGTDYSSLPSSQVACLDAYSQVCNGTRIRKRGIEYQFSSARIAPLHTRIVVNGAWFRSLYSSSLPLFEVPSGVVDGRSVSEVAIGLYDGSDGRQVDQFNSNFMLDTQIPSLGLIFTSSLQATWFVRSSQLQRNGTPLAYVSVDDGLLHPFTDSSAQDPTLLMLIKSYRSSSVVVPVAMFFNLKVSKNLADRLVLSFFANKIIDYSPDYQSNGVTIRRSADPYFGVECNVNLGRLNH